jgi:hypothetical protein
MSLVLYQVNSAFLGDKQRSNLIWTFAIWFLESLYYSEAKIVIFASFE